MRTAVLGAWIVAITAALAGAALVYGSIPLPAGEVLAHFTGGGGVAPATGAILRIRVDRLILAMVTGASLGVSGTVLQAVLRNPLADPYVLGTSSGAACGAALALILGIRMALAPPLFALVGAAGSTMLVYAIARSAGGGVPRERLLLAGVIVGFFLGAVIMVLMTLSREMLPGIVAVLMGNLDHPFVPETRVAFRFSCVLVAIGLLLSFAHIREMDALCLGDEAAAHLGVSVERVRILLFLASSLLVGCVVSFTGLIGFVGLVVPHAVRMVVGPAHRRLLPLAAVGGAGLLTASDLLARNLTVSPLPVGVVTSLLGGPFFLYLLKTRRTEG